MSENEKKLWKDSKKLKRRIRRIRREGKKGKYIDKREK